MSSELTIGFLGAGKMGTALAKGFIQAGLVTKEQIIASDPMSAAAAAFAAEVGSRATAANLEVVKFARVVFLAVKPDQVGGVLAGIREAFTPGHLLISIAANIGMRMQP